jgi:hypothetical protein
MSDQELANKYKHCQKHNHDDTFRGSYVFAVRSERDIRERADNRMYNLGSTQINQSIGILSLATAKYVPFAASRPVNDLRRTVLLSVLQQQ